MLPKRTHTHTHTHTHTSLRGHVTAGSSERSSVPRRRSRDQHEVRWTPLGGVGAGWVMNLPRVGSCVCSLPPPGDTPTPPYSLRTRTGTGTSADTFIAGGYGRLRQHHIEKAMDQTRHPRLQDTTYHRLQALASTPCVKDTSGTATPLKHIRLGFKIRFRFQRSG